MISRVPTRRARRCCVKRRGFRGATVARAAGLAVFRATLGASSTPAQALNEGFRCHEKIRDTWAGI